VEGEGSHLKLSTRWLALSRERSQIRQAYNNLTRVWKCSHAMNYESHSRIFQGLRFEEPRSSTLFSCKSLIAFYLMLKKGKRKKERKKR